MRYSAAQEFGDFFFMRFFLCLLLFSYGLFAWGLTEGDEKIQGYNEYVEKQSKFEKERMGALEDFLKSKKVDLTEWEKDRLEYVEARKKELANSVSSEAGPHFREFLDEKANFDRDKEMAYRSYHEEREKIREEAKSKKMLAFELKELGLDKDSEKYRVALKKRNRTGTVASTSGGSGGGGGSPGGGGGYMPPPPSGPPIDNMDDMEPPPPPEFDEGESMPVPPVPPPID
jgi:uncharacterized membrane protein YgcG